MSARPVAWIHWPRAEVTAISDALRDAHNAFDRAYFSSPIAADLAQNVAETVDALRRVADLLGPVVPSSRVMGGEER